MSRLKRLLVSGVLLLLMAAPVSARTEVYRTTDKDGNVTFTDKKADNKDVAPVEIRPVQTIPAPKIPSVKKRQQTKGLYKSISITSPADEETFHNPESITITINSTPSLKPGHRYVFSMNGKKLNEGPAKKFILEQPDRGALTFKAEVLNAKGKGSDQ